MTAHSPLHKLTRRFAAQALSKQAYRKARNDFLNDILTDKTDLISITFPPLVVPLHTIQKQQLSKDKDKNEAQTAIGIDRSIEPVEQSTSTPMQPKTDMLSFWIYMLIAVIIICVFSLSVMLWHKNPQPATHIPVAASKPIIPANNGKSLINNFLSAQRWQSAELEAFVTAWQNLSPSDRAAAIQSAAMTHLSDKIYKRLVEEQALRSILGKENSRLKEQELIDFAQSIGIVDPRITQDMLAH